MLYIVNISYYKPANTYCIGEAETDNSLYNVIEYYDSTFF